MAPIASQPVASVVALAVFAVLFAILVFTEPAEGLTAFGKSPSSDRNDKNASRPQKPKLKVCLNDTECKVEHTRCRINQIDGKKHCVCPDGSQPDNGACKLKGLAPGDDCTSNKCAPGSYCTTNTSLSKKICVCEDGFYDDNSHKGFRFCNGASLSVIPHAPSVLFGVAIYGAIRSLLQSH